MAVFQFLNHFDPTWMRKLLSSFATLIGRLIKIVMVVVLLPLAVSLLQGILQQLDLMSASRATFLEWVTWGFVVYLAVHILLYRPVAVFKISHRMFSTIAVWLFGGYVASTEGGGNGKGKSAKGSKGRKAEGGAQGSTLVAFSPYVIPLYTVLVCAAGWLLSRWFDRRYLDGLVSFLVGATIAFHWMMTADDLQQQREQWHLETYLLAIGFVFALTLLVGGACLPWAVPEFSFVRALGDGFLQAQTIYTTLIQRLFL